MPCKTHWPQFFSVVWIKCFISWLHCHWQAKVYKCTKKEMSDSRWHIALKADICFLSLNRQWPFFWKTFCSKNNKTITVLSSISHETLKSYCAIKTTAERGFNLLFWLKLLCAAAVSHDTSSFSTFSFWYCLWVFYFRIVLLVFLQVF